MNLHDKFTEANNWMVNAILEKILGRLPTKDELRHAIRIQYNEDDGINKIFYGDRLIMESQFTAQNGIMQGWFNIPEQYIDEFIQERVDNWSK